MRRRAASEERGEAPREFERGSRAPAKSVAAGRQARSPPEGREIA